MKITTRPVKLSDSADISKYLFLQSEEEETKKNLEEDIQKMKQGELIRIVAEVDGKVIGQCDFRRPPSAIKQHIVDITRLVINSDYRGNGICTKLMKYGLRWAKEHGAEMVTISVRKGTKAKDIYLHYGFQIYGELKRGIRETWGEKKVYDEVFLVKYL